MPPYFHLFDSVALAEHRWPNHMREPITLGVRASCSVRPDKTLTDGEGPHAKSWLTARGDTVRLRHRDVLVGLGVDVVCEQVLARRKERGCSLLEAIITEARA